MSRTRTFGRSVKLLTVGPDAIDPNEIEQRTDDAYRLLDRNFIDTLHIAYALGIALDTGSYTTFETSLDDGVLLSWKCSGRQTRNVLTRIWKAIKA